MAADFMAGWTATLTEFGGWLANARNLTDSERRAAQRVLDQYRQSVVSTMERTYDDGASHRDREFDSAERILTELGELMADTIERLKRGEVSGDEALQIAAEVQRDATRAVASSEAAERVEDNAWQSVASTPEAFQAEVLSRFPALKSRLPRITDDVMAGRENPFR